MGVCCPSASRIPSRLTIKSCSKTQRATTHTVNCELYKLFLNEKSPRIDFILRCHQGRPPNVDTAASTVQELALVLWNVDTVSAGEEQAPHPGRDLLDRDQRRNLRYVR